MSLFAPLRGTAYRRLWLSQVASESGDWAGRLALSAVVYGQTGSALWSALAFVGGLLPMLGPGQVLATYADALGKRSVMIVADVARAGVFAVLALAPHLPVGVVLLLAVVAGLATAPFEAARGAAVFEISEGQDIGAAVSLTHATQDLAVVVGYALGAWLLAALGAQAALAVNAVTFLVSAGFLSLLPRLGAGAAAAPPGKALRTATVALLGDPLTRRLVLLGTTAVASGSAVDALVVPFAARTGHAWLAGVVLGGIALVSLGLTLLLSTRRGNRLLLQITAWATVGSAAPCALGLLTGWLPAEVLGLLASGGLYITLVAASIIVGPRLPQHVRATCFALLAGVLTATQVALSALGGVLADVLDPARAGAVLMLVPILAWGWNALLPLGTVTTSSVRPPVPAQRKGRQRSRTTLTSSQTGSSAS